MNRSPLLTVALVLTASAFPAAQAQTPNKPSPTIAPAVTAPAPVAALVSKPAPADPLKGLRVHLAALRSVPLAQPQAVPRVPQAVLRSSWMEVAHGINVTHR